MANPVTDIEEREAIVRLAGGVIVGVDRADGADTYCEALYDTETGVWTILDLYEIAHKSSNPTQ